MHRAVPLFVILLASGIAGCAHTHSAAGNLAVATTSASTTILQRNERTLWSNQTVRMREYIAAAFADERSARVAQAQLARTREAIGETIKPYYGETAGAGLTAMLKVQDGIATELVRAVKADDVARREEFERRLHENSNAIARYLAGLNPHWSPTELESLLNRYFDVSTLDMIARKGGRVDGDDKTLDGSVSQARELADVLAEGIIRQFPYGPPYPREGH